jgi:hypothetical protein
VVFSDARGVEHDHRGHLVGADEARCAAAIGAVLRGDHDAAATMFADSIVIGPALGGLHHRYERRVA